jgi:hypothetical protein
MLKSFSLKPILNFVLCAFLTIFLYILPTYIIFIDLPTNYPLNNHHPQTANRFLPASNPYNPYFATAGTLLPTTMLGPEHAALASSTHIPQSMSLAAATTTIHAAAAAQQSQKRQNDRVQVILLKLLSLVLLLLVPLLLLLVFIISFTHCLKPLHSLISSELYLSHFHHAYNNNESHHCHRLLV